MYDLIARAVFNQPWAIHEDWLAAICGVVEARMKGERLAPEEIEARLQAVARDRQGAQRAGAVAVLPLYGVISPRQSMMSQTSGGTSAEQWGREFSSLVADPQVSAIVIDVDSPGGAVAGIQELWDTIHQARGVKPVVAVANSMAASAAYWLASAAESISVTPSGEVGSIGVIYAHTDVSEMQKMQGVKTTLITAGKHKGEGHPSQPLSEEARAHFQETADRHYQTFVAAVARGRGVTPAAVRGGFGEGRMVGAKEAVSLGMADRVETLDQAVQRLAGGGRSRGRMSAQDDLDLRARRLRLAEIS